MTSEALPRSWWSRLTLIESSERLPVILSFCYFFFVLAGYYMIRPLRDALGVGTGVNTMQWLYTGTFFAMLLLVPLYGWISSRYARRQFVPWVYGFFILNLLGFFWALQHYADTVWLGRTFFIWVSVFNLFVVAVFWSVMSDVFRLDQAKRLFGVIAAGGSAGAVCGPLFAQLFIEGVGTTYLPLCSAIALSMALACLLILFRWSAEHPEQVNREANPDKPMGGGIWEGLKLLASNRLMTWISLLMLLGTLCGTLIYLTQAQLVSENFSDITERTLYFTQVDRWTNILTVLLQMFVAGRLMQNIGIPKVLLLLPAVVMMSFMAMAASPVIAMVAIGQMLRRSSQFALNNPALSAVFTSVGPQARYKARQSIDTVVWRGGDLVSSWIVAGLTALGLGVAGKSIFGIFAALAFLLIAWYVGRLHGKRAMSQSDSPK